ncbi:uncharacterized protein TM35_000016090 [Trypanosoma theileri]|uniref:Uncharacterized protein n=1 Tax=Trypanosoma theileri TaxID=67003 RepID=A0A1X0P9X1_9TRYP|nr:uncharacterized protein TM35_000016090 [Trypanosoma theileri]ORC93732.1 hypothetical protein TM35_000016090 [Trypanosoma theileri]
MGELHKSTQQPLLAAVVSSGRVPLRFAAPKRRPHLLTQQQQREEQEKELYGDIVSRREISLRRSFNSLQPPLTGCSSNIIAVAAALELRNFTDEDAARLTSPDAPHCHVVDEVVDALFTNFTTAPTRCKWNTPVPRPEWKNEFRLRHEWWISLRVLPLSMQMEEHHPPMIPWGIRSIETENQFLADIALHMRRKGAVFTLLHLDHIALTPERANVLLFDGVLRNASHALECFSIPFCEVGAATLLLLLCGFNHCRALQPQLRYLNLSYNWINTSCTYMLAMLLSRTSVRRLSLRGNRFGGGDMLTFQDFLLQGCCLLEELDLGYTCLTRAEVCALIRCLPEMPNLQVLLLDGIHVPASKAVALSTAIRKSKLTYVSLKGIAACSGEAYLHRIHLACQRHKTERILSNDQLTMRELAETGSFFEAFARRTGEWMGTDNSALPPSYRPFTTNEPSLPPIDEYP